MQTMNDQELKNYILLGQLGSTLVSGLNVSCLLQPDVVVLLAFVFQQHFQIPATKKKKKWAIQ